MTSFKSWRSDAVRQRHAELCAKYPNFTDFDAVGTREYVLYADGVSMMDDSEIEERYRDIVWFEALSAIDDKSWREAGSLRVHTTDEKEIAHLTEYAQRVADTQLRLRLERALDDAAMRSAGSGDASRDFNNDFYLVRSLRHFPDDRYGIHIKRTNEFGIYSFYVFDDGESRHSYYRSDPTFQLEQPLHVLHAVFEEVAPKR